MGHTGSKHLKHGKMGRSLKRTGSAGDIQDRMTQERKGSVTGIAGPELNYLEMPGNRLSRPPTGAVSNVMQSHPTVMALPSVAEAPGAAGQNKSKTAKNKLVIALYPYQSHDESELDFKKGDRLLILDDNDPDWWLARTLVDERNGFVPRNFIIFEPLEAEEWFFGTVTRKEAERLLLFQDVNQRGAFLVRNSDSRTGFSLSVRDKDPNRGGDHVKHYRIRAVDGGFCITSRRVFPNLPDLITFYRAPTGNTGLSIQLTKPCPKEQPDFWPGRQDEIPRHLLEFHNRLGSGNFGDVYYGIFSGKTEVAIKTLKPGSMSPQAFLEEAAVMRKYRHEKLVRLFGVCSQQEPLLLITEFMCNGSLLSFLRDHPDGKLLENGDMIFMAAQVASGMAFLESTKLIHRDLAARNILVGRNKIVKVADFGLAKLIGDDEYEMKRGTKFPIKWTAPEAVCYGKFSSKADVWSFGVLLWEIWTKGGVPYPEMANREVIEQIQKGYRMPCPMMCPDKIYKTMLHCWDAEADGRPTFANLADFFDNYADEAK